MSDEAIAPNLEDDTPAPPVAQEPQAETPQEPKAAEVEAVEVAGEKYVPVSAIIAERKARQIAEQAAQRAQEIEQWAYQNRPYVDFLKNNPQLLQQRQEPPPQAPAAPNEDPEAREAALLMDFYTADGKPDVEKGARWLALQDRRAQKAAGDVMRPLAQSTAQE